MRSSRAAPGKNSLSIINQDLEAQSWFVRESVNSSTQRGVPGARSRLPRLPGAKLSISYNSVPSLKNRYERVSSSNNLKQRRDMRGYLAAAARSKISAQKLSQTVCQSHPSASAAPTHHCSIKYQKSIIKSSVMKYLQSSQFLKSLVTTATINDSPIQIIRM